MPGKVRHRQSHPRNPVLEAQRKIRARMVQADDSNSIFQLNNTTRPMLSRQAIIWITLVSVIVITAFVVIGWLLCRCKRKRKANIERHSDGHRHHPSLEVTDGRNEHLAWNRNAKPSRVDTDQSANSLTPFSKAAVRPAGTDPHPGEPVIIDQEEDPPLSPVYARNKGSRYYSELGGAWQRISQIGRAY